MPTGLSRREVRSKALEPEEQRILNRRLDALTDEVQRVTSYQDFELTFTGLPTPAAIAVKHALGRTPSRCQLVYSNAPCMVWAAEDIGWGQEVAYIGASAAARVIVRLSVMLLSVMPLAATATAECLVQRHTWDYYVCDTYAEAVSGLPVDPQEGDTLWARDLAVFCVWDATAWSCASSSAIASDDQVFVHDGATWVAATLVSGALAYSPIDNTFSQAGVASLASSTSTSLRGVLSDEIGTGPAMFGLSPSMSDDLSCSGDQVVRRNSGDTAFECATLLGGADPWTRLTVPSDVSTNSSAAYTAVSSLDWSASASTNYRMRCVLLTSTAAGTTGLQLQIQGPSSPSEITFERKYHNNSSTAETSIVSNAFHSSSSDDGAAGSCSTSICLNYLDMILFNTNAGTVAFAIQSEVSLSDVIVHAGTWCERMTF